MGFKTVTFPNFLFFLITTSTIADGTFTTHWIPTLDMPADIFMKPLSSPLFIKHHNSLGLISIWYFLFCSYLMGVC
jgi:hypothetical protein